MRYDEFRKKAKGLPLISGPYLKMIAGPESGFATQLLRWQKAGKIVRLKRNLYVLNENDRSVNPSRLFVARELYSPSYVSMEYALALYDLIPERVSDITSITTKKTIVFDTHLGRFVYQHVKEKCFTGFRELKDESGLSYYLAYPEKALVDFLYLNQHIFKEDYRETANESFRLQNVELLDRRKLLKLAWLFDNKKMIKIIESLLRKNND